MGREICTSTPAARRGAGSLKSVYVGERWHKCDGGLVFYQVKALIAIESKLLVAGKERKTLGDGMGNDDVVAGIAMVLLLVELQVGVCEGRIAAQGQELDAVVLLNGGEHLSGRLPVLRQEGLVIEVYDQLAGRFKAGKQHYVWVIYDVPKLQFCSVRTRYQFNNSTGVKD